MKDHLRYERCPECGLKIRCGDAEAHAAGLHHKRRVETLKAKARKGT